MNLRLGRRWSSLLHGVGRLGDSVQERVVTLGRATLLGGVEFCVVDELHERLFHLGVLFEAEEAGIAREFCPASSERFGAGLVGLGEGIGLECRGQQRGCGGFDWSCRYRGGVGGDGSLAGVEALAGDGDVVQYTQGAFADGEIGGWVECEDPRGGGLHVSDGGLDGGWLGDELARVESAVQIAEGNGELAELVGCAPGTGEGLPGGFALFGKVAVDLEGVSGAFAILEHASYLEQHRGLVGRIAGRDEQLVAGAGELVDGDEVLGELEANIAPTLVAVAFPGAVDGGLVVVDGLGLKFLAGGESGELEVDDAAAGLGVAKGREVGDGLVGFARLG